MAANVVKYSLNKVFPLPNIPDSATCLGYTPEGNPFIPVPNEEYVFRRELIREVTAFLKAPHGDALYIAGPTGSGKTSGITEIAARLNWPVQQITAHGRMELADLIGHHALVSPQPGHPPVMQWMPGVLPIAMKEGHILLINEVDQIDPSELSGLNDVLEGRPLVISQNGGEIIHPHPMFRVVVTGNSTGNGDATGLYQGVQMQNLAAMDRYRVIVVGYADEAVELGILAKVVPNLAEEIRNGMVRLANAIRGLFMGTSESDGELSVTMSTRTLVRWARLSLQFRGAQNPVHYALDQALLNRTSKEESEAILRLAKDIFGEAWR